MAQSLEELALFPLNTVLFPHAHMRLHVFEDRYRELVQHCLRHEVPFGIVLIRNGSEVGGGADPYLVGTLARIVAVETYDDGRMDIQIRGEERFRIRRIDEDIRPYPVGYVEPVLELEIENPNRAEELLIQAREHFEIYIQQSFANRDLRVEVRFPTEPVALSFNIANLLPMDNLEKQKMLETTDTLERIEDLLPVMQAQLLEIRDPRVFKLRAADLSDWVSPN
ncbi:MAG: LON peptidase substrate-binding domain-containing protein [Fimbriimonas sp.]